MYIFTPSWRGIEWIYLFNYIYFFLVNISPLINNEQLGIVRCITFFFQRTKNIEDLNTHILVCFVN